MTERPVLFRLERDGEIATIVLDNPKKLNAWSWESAGISEVCPPRTPDPMFK